jgi:hypothetical protein
MREPDTPGGFSESMPCRPASSSATTDDAMVEYWQAMIDQGIRRYPSFAIREVPSCQAESLCHAPVTKVRCLSSRSSPRYCTLCKAATNVLRDLVCASAITREDPTREEACSVAKLGRMVRGAKRSGSPELCSGEKRTEQADSAQHASLQPLYRSQGRPCQGQRICTGVTGVWNGMRMCWGWRAAIS